ncbi:MAG: PDZ domain-containing protein, partial [Planctomycetota bacterium]|nr:PDZ domain-containing protein [Planctomycetota bacterium]
SDRSGEYELYLRNMDGSEFTNEGALPGLGLRQMTNMGAGWKYQADWSPDGKYLAFGTYEGRLYSLNVETAELREMTRASNVGQVRMSFSPDSRWLAWHMGHSGTHNPAIFLYDLEQGALHQVTSGMFADTMPSFDISGDWLFFLSSRTFNPSYADLDSTWIYDETSNVMAVALHADVESPFAPEGFPDGWGTESSDEKSEEKDASEDSEKESESTSENGEDTAEEEPEPASKDILLEGFEARAQQLPLKHRGLISVGGMDGAVAYFASPSDPNAQGFEMYTLAMTRDAEAKKVIGGIQSLSMTPDRTKMLVRTSAGWGIVGTSEGQKIDKTLKFEGLQGTYDPRAEWDQMLLETYRLYRDFFYDPGMHGVDWRGEYERYSAALKGATHREDLHYLIGEMISELNVGHAYNRGNREVNHAGKASPGVGPLGCDYELANGAYRIQRVLGTPYDSDTRSPLSAPGVSIEVGDYILAVDGQPIDASTSIYKAFIGKAGKTVRLLVNKTPNRDGEERVVSVETISSESALRYRTWVHDKREMVRTASQGRIGYIHVPDTGIRGQNELMRQFVGEMHHEALIIDERWNGGGQIPWRFIELLNRPTLNYWATRGEKPWDFPGMRHAGPKCMLINGAAGSGGDCFPYYFRQKNLGTIIGTRTWGGLVGISGNPSLIDGANTSIPTFGFYELDGTWGVENYGVDPDIEVLDDPGKMLDGGDPQLQAGIDHLLQELKANPPSKVQRPRGPNRSGAVIPKADR